MLNITGMNRFYYLRNFHDMRCKYDKGEEITLQRNSLRTKDVIGRIRCFLNVLTSKRFIRASERKNSLFFGSNRMANVLASYLILISTCWANGISAQVYLKNLFCEVVKGRRDYENLLPMTIGINTNNFKNQDRFLKTLRGKLPKGAFPMGYVKIGRLRIINEIN